MSGIKLSGPHRVTKSSLAPSQEDPNNGHLDALLAPPHLRWRRDALQTPELQRGCLDRNTVSIFQKEVFDVSPGKQGGSPTSRERKHDYFSRFTGSNDILPQEIHWKDELLHALQILALRFQFFGTFTPNNANACVSAIHIHKDLSPDDATVTHVVTCQGRDHIVNIRSGCEALWSSTSTSSLN